MKINIKKLQIIDIQRLFSQPKQLANETSCWKDRGYPRVLSNP